MSIIVDTNVAVVASGCAIQADAKCVKVCMDRLSNVMQTGGLLVDDLGRILKEYTNNLGFKGQPGAGHAFVRWVHVNQAIPARVKQITITARPSSDRRKFEQFPDHAALARFDPSDQKFVAVAIASGVNPTILNAVDGGWWKHRDALRAAGVSVEFVCRQHMPRT